MEKASYEMDLDDWDFLSDDEFSGFHHHESGEKGLVSSEIGFDPKGVIKMDYFVCPSPDNSSVTRGMNQILPIPIRFESIREENPDQGLVKEIIKHPLPEINIKTPVNLQKVKDPIFRSAGEDQETVTQVFFEKKKDNQFDDMKMDSPKSNGRGIRAQMETESVQFEKKGEAEKGEDMEQEMIKKNKNCLDSNIKEEMNWGWRLTGIGALCSIGVAAATVCIFIFGSRQTHNQHQQNQKLRFQIYKDDKRIKKVVHHATKLNQAISAVRAVPHTVAHITCGGCYDGL